MAASPQSHFLQRVLPGEQKCESQASQGENLGYLHLQNLGFSSAREILLPQASWKPDWEGIFILFLFLWSDWRIWERPWRGIPPSGCGTATQGETQLVTGSGLTSLGYLRKIPTAQSSCWSQRLQRQFTSIYTHIYTYSFQIKGFKPPN